MCYVSDTVRGIASVMDCDFHEPINIGNPEEVTILQLAREILSLVPHTNSRIVFRPSPDYDPRQRRPDITRARQICGWTPQVNRTDGLKLLIDYFERARAAGAAG